MMIGVKLSNSCRPCYLFISREKYQKQYILHFFILINLYHAQPTTNMYNSLAFFVHEPLTLTNNLLLLWNESIVFTLPNTKVIK